MNKKDGKFQLNNDYKFNIIGRFRSPDKLDQSMKKVNPLDYTKYTNEDVNDTITSLRRLKQVKFE